MLILNWEDSKDNLPTTETTTKIETLCLNILIWLRSDFGTTDRKNLCMLILNWVCHAMIWHKCLGNPGLTLTAYGTTCWNKTCMLIFNLVCLANVSLREFQRSSVKITFLPLSLEMLIERIILMGEGDYWWSFPSKEFSHSGRMCRCASFFLSRSKIAATYSLNHWWYKTTCDNDLR